MSDPGDTLVFDIETQNFFTDPGVGWENFEALKISAVGVYSYARDEYSCFEESEIAKAAELFRESRTLVGFSLNRYDIPVLNVYFQRLGGPKLNLWEKERVDLLEKVESVAGQRISLSRLAEANLGVGKDRHGSEAIELYRDGRIEELKAYCVNDVKLTKGLYDLYVKQGYFLFPDKRTGEVVKLYLHDEAAQKESAGVAKSDAPLF